MWLDVWDTCDPDRWSGRPWKLQLFSSFGKQSYTSDLLSLGLNHSMLNRSASEPSGGNCVMHTYNRNVAFCGWLLISFMNVVISFKTSFAKAEIRLWCVRVFFLKDMLFCFSLLLKKINEEIQAWLLFLFHSNQKQPVLSYKDQSLCVYYQIYSLLRQKCHRRLKLSSNKFLKVARSFGILL